ncbi:MAG: hypothetical protein WBP29_13310 [Candidatus Zixiibacteriota bacterium]
MLRRVLSRTIIFVLAFDAILNSAIATLTPPLILTEESAPPAIPH